MNSASSKVLPDEQSVIDAHYDVAIVGGGMSGVTAALCYAQLGLKIALIDAVAPRHEMSTSFDQRAIALAASSVAIYRSLGLWPLLQSLANPIAEVHVSDQGHFGFTRLYAKDYQLSALGEVVPLELAGPVLWDQAAQASGIQIYCPAKVTDVAQTSEQCRLTLEMAETGESQQTLSAKLVLAADGTYSALAQANQIETTRNGYHQHAVIANIQTELAHGNRAFERFTASGPLALLPLTGQRMSLVWCHKPDSVESVMAMDDVEFCAQLQTAFGYRLGRITRVGQRLQYPLSLHLAERPFAGRVLLMGNSMHTLHPIAGQGFNLGLRDIAALNDQFIEAIANSIDIGSQAFLQQYVDNRMADWQQTVLATDSLARLFSNEFLPLQLSRTKAMNCLNSLPFAKHHLANSAMGYQHRSSRLARGLSNQFEKQ